MPSDGKNYCEKCGYPIPPGAEECPSCREIANRPLNLATEKVKAASKDAFKAFRHFAGNPIEGLPIAYESVGEAKAVGVGLVFAVATGACVMVGYFGLPKELTDNLAGGIHGFVGFLKALAFSGVAFITIALSSLIVRKVFKGAGSFGGDCFTAGASLLPLGVMLLAMGILGTGSNLWIVEIVLAFAVCFTVLLLYAGCTQIAKLSTRVSSLAVPIMLVIGGALMKVIYGVVFRS